MRTSYPRARPAAQSQAQPAGPSYGGGAVAARAERDTAGARVLFGLVIALLLFSVGRIGEVVGFLGNVPIAKLLIVAVVITLVVSRGKLIDTTAFKARQFKLVMALAALCLFSFVYSAWRSQTFTFITVHLVMLVLLVVLIVGTTRSLPRLNLIALVTMLIGLPLALGALLAATSDRVKFGLTYDPNDLAYLLGILLPFLYARSQNTNRRLLRWGLYATMAVYVAAAVMTQSRGGMIGISLTAVYLSWKGLGMVDAQGRYEVKSRGRWHRLAALAVLGMLALIAMPDGAKQRLGTIFDLSNDYNITAADNDNGRLSIWKRGLSVLAQRPWGVGANAYPIADYMAGGRYITAHNSTLQAYVELGVVGGTLFIAIIVSTWRMAGRARRRILTMTPTPERTQLLGLFTAIRAALIVVIVSGSFLSQAYGLVLYVLVALAICAERLLGELAESSAEDEAAAQAQEAPSRQRARAGRIVRPGSRRSARRTA